MAHVHCRRSTSAAIQSSKLHSFEYWTDSNYRAFHQSTQYHMVIIIITISIIIIIYPLTSRVVGAPQMISQPVSFIFPCFPLDLANSRPVHSLMLSSHLFLCLPCLLPPFTVPCEMVLARPDKREKWPYYCSLRLFTMVRRSSCGPIACWILARPAGSWHGLMWWNKQPHGSQIESFWGKRRAQDLARYRLLMG